MILSRRRFLRSSAGAGLAGLFLAACGGGERGRGSDLSTPQAAGSTSGQGPVSGQGTAQFRNIGRLVVREEPYPQYEGAPQKTDILRVVGSALGESVSPVSVEGGYAPLTHVYDPLVWIDEWSTEAKPSIAQSWEISPDGMTYTYKLREGVTFHDGSPLTAEDVAFSYTVYRDDPTSRLAGYVLAIEGDPVVVDQHTIRFDLSQPSSDFLPNGGNQFILQKKQFEALWSSDKTLRGYPYTEQMLIGSGPWKQVNFEPGGAPPNVQYEANPSYWRGSVNYDKMTFQGIARAEARLTSWLSGETDVLWPVTAQQIEQVKHQDGWLYVAPTVAWMEAHINFNNPEQPQPDFLRGKQVRQALSVGINREGYLQSVFGGFADVSAVGPVPMRPVFNDALKNPDYDPEKAQQMLADAGYRKNSSGNLVGADGEVVRLTALVETSNTYPVEKIAATVQEDFRKLGIAMQIDQVDRGAVRSRRTSVFDWDLYFQGRIAFAGWNEYLFYHTKGDPRSNPQGNNYGAYSNADVDQVLDQILVETDANKLKDQLFKMQDMMADDMPSLWFGFPFDLILVKKNILGYQPNIMWQYWNLWQTWNSA